MRPNRVCSLFVVVKEAVKQNKDPQLSAVNPCFLRVGPGIYSELRSSLFGLLRNPRLNLLLRFKPASPEITIPERHEAVRVLKWARQDLNLRPIDYESTALTTELRALICGAKMDIFMPTAAQKYATLSLAFSENCVHDEKTNLTNL